MAEFREFVLATGRTVIAGKDAENNDVLVSKAEPKDILIHTAAPGSPFCNVGPSPKKKELKEAATLTASKSQIWRDSKKDVLMHIFRKADVYKEKRMKAGTWSVKKFKEMRIKKGDILKCVQE